MQDVSCNNKLVTTPIAVRLRPLNGLAFDSVPSLFPPLSALFLRSQHVRPAPFSVVAHLHEIATGAALQAPNLSSTDVAHRPCVHINNTFCYYELFCIVKIYPKIKRWFVD